MGLTHFKRGVSSYGQPVLPTNGMLYGTTGNVFFVCATGGSDSYAGTDPDNPMATIDAAVNKCTASKGDVIYVMPGHAETLAAAITMDVAGVSIIGLGQGTNRGTITVAANIDGITMTAANCAVRNLYFVAGTAAHTATINIAAADCEVADCRFLCGANNLETITITADGNYAKVERCYFTITADGPDSAIRLEGASVGVIIRGNLFNGGDTAASTWDNAAVYSSSTPQGNVIEGNRGFYSVINGAGVQIIFTGSATGILADNYVYSDAGTGANLVDPGSMGAFNTLQCDIIDNTGGKFPVTTSA